MRNVVSLAAVLLISACGSGNTTRYFRVLIPVAGTGANARPDSCYQAATLAGATMPDEIAAEAYCAVGKKPSSTGTTSTQVSSQPMTIVDTGDGKLYLVLTTGATSFGLEGVLNNGTYSFTRTNSGFTKQCPVATAGVQECNGACVNVNSDPAHCGACADPCPTGMACQNRICVMACTVVMQLCAGVMTNVRTDEANCGFCGNMCMAGQVCSEGICGTACGARCTDGYSSADCGTPRQFSRVIEDKIDFTLQGGALSGTFANTQSYACMPPGCAADFAQRCPTCVQSYKMVGRELSNVTEFEQR